MAARKELGDVGRDAGPGRIWSHLLVQGLGGVPHESTIWRVLVRRGFVVADPSKAPRGAGRRFQAKRANEVWQIDDTWELADGDEVRIVNVEDDCTRVLVATVAVSTTSGDTAFDAFARDAQRFGWPARFLSDNAPAFRHSLAVAFCHSDQTLNDRPGRPNRSTPVRDVPRHA